jgi:hypothetical protein
MNFLDTKFYLKLTRRAYPFRACILILSSGIVEPGSKSYHAILLYLEAVPKLQFLEQLLTPEKIAKAVTA